MAPVSQIRFPLGCAIRKQPMDMSVVVTSSFFKLKRPISALWRTPQSNTIQSDRARRLRLVLCGRSASAPPLFVGAEKTSAAAAATRNNRITLRFIIAEPHSLLADGSSGLRIVRHCIPACLQLASRQVAGP